MRALYNQLPSFPLRRDVHSTGKKLITYEGKKIQQIINYIRKPNPDKLEELLLSVKKKDTLFFKAYIENCLIENKGFQPNN